MGTKSREKKERKETQAANATKGWKIDIAPYNIRVIETDDDGKAVIEGGKPVYIESPFDVQESLCNILFQANLQLSPADAFKAYDLAQKIRSADGRKPVVILDNAEMAQIRRAYDAVKGVNEQMLEFLRRIRDAEQVELTEA